MEIFNATDLYALATANPVVFGVATLVVIFGIPSAIAGTAKGVGTLLGAGTRLAGRTVKNVYFGAKGGTKERFIPKTSYEFDNWVPQVGEQWRIPSKNGNTQQDCEVVDVFRRKDAGKALFVVVEFTDLDRTVEYTINRWRAGCKLGRAIV